MLKPIYLYRFTNGDQSFLYTNVGAEYDLDDETFVPEKISHTRPKITDDISKASVTISVPFDNPVVVLHSLSALPNPTEVLIYKFYEGVTEVEVYWRGQVIRPNLDDSNATLECNTKLDSLDIEGLSETPGILCAYRLGDGRCTVDLENHRLSVTVIDVGISDEGVAFVEVTGIADPDDRYERGTIEINGDWRSIISQVGGRLVLDHAFPADVLNIDDTPDIFPGCDRAVATCIGKFGDETAEGDAFGGEPTLPTQNPHDVGRI